MVNEKYKHIFIHIPKTGGWSMTAMPWNGNGAHDHTIHHTMRMHFDDGIKLDDYFKWCFVRHPLDRLVSAYHWGMKNNKKTFLSDIKNFADFIDKIEDFYDFSQEIHKNPQLRKGIHVIPQYHFIDGFEMDFIGKFENLHNDWDYVCNKISEINNNIELKRNLPHKFKSKHIEYMAYYGDKQLEKVYNIYKKDFELFDYKL